MTERLHPQWEHLSRTFHNAGNFLNKHPEVKNPIELLALTAVAYTIFMIGSRVAIPALNNMVEILTTAIGK